MAGRWLFPSSILIMMVQEVDSGFSPLSLASTIMVYFSAVWWRKIKFCSSWMDVKNIEFSCTIEIWGDSCWKIKMESFNFSSSNFSHLMVQTSFKRNDSNACLIDLFEVELKILRFRFDWNYVKVNFVIYLTYVLICCLNSTHFSAC